jgi:hypothetical protein
MLYLILSTLIMVALLDRALRGGRNRLLKLDLEFQLFALRDELRNSASAGEIPYNNWFDYMDTTLTRAIGFIDKFNPWLAVGLVRLYKNDLSLRVAYEQLRQALRQPENRRIARVYDSYLNSVGQFLKSRYPISWPLAALVFMMLCDEKHEHSSIEKEEQQLAPIFSIAPESSTLREHSPITPREAHSPVGEASLAI